MLLSIRSLLNNEPFTFANLILHLFADFLGQLKSDVCGLTDIHKSTNNGDQPHDCGDLARHTPINAAIIFQFVTGWITNISTRTTPRALTRTKSRASTSTEPSASPSNK